MANPVHETIASWQSDAAAADSNLPTAASACGIGDAQDLSGNLRLLKSEMRLVNAQMSWERWLGVKNLAFTGNIAFTTVNNTTFTINDNFTPTGRNVAIPGRRIRALFNTGAVIAGSIVSATWSPPLTGVIVTWDGGSLAIAPLLEIQFGPEPASLPAGAQSIMINRTGYPMGVGNIVCPSSANDTSVVLPDQRATLRPVLACTSNAANGAAVGVISAGLCTIAMDTAVLRGRYLISSSAGSAGASDSGENVGSGYPPYGTFGMSISSVGVPGLISALLFGTTVQPPLIQSTANGYGRRFVSGAPADTSQMVPGDMWLQY